MTFDTLLKKLNMKKGNFITKDSGSRQQFSTGAKRDIQDGKPRPDLISPHALLRLGALLARGAEKYGERNWEMGMPFSRFLASAHRHLLQFMAGDRDEDHLAAVCFNIMAIIHFEEVERGDLNDLISYVPGQKTVLPQQSKKGTKRGRKAKK